MGRRRLCPFLRVTQPGSSVRSGITCRRCRGRNDSALPSRILPVSSPANEEIIEKAIPLFAGASLQIGLRRDKNLRAPDNLEPAPLDDLAEAEGLARMLRLGFQPDRAAGTVEVLDAQDRQHLGRL